MKIVRRKLVDLMVGVYVFISTSVLTAGIYSGFFDDPNGEATAQKKVIAPMDNSANTVTFSPDEIKN